MSRDREPGREWPAIGVDIGGGKIALGVVARRGEVTELEEYPTLAQRGPEAIIVELIQRLAELREKAESEPLAIGVGICGQVSMDRGAVLSSPNLPGWDNVPLRDRLERGLELPVVVGNDVNVIALGEWSQTTGQEVRDMVVVFIGTGLGGGVVADGRLLTGHLGHAAEIGHTTIVVDGRECSCGNRGCLEAYVGGWALAKQARQAAERDPELGAGIIERAGGLDRIRSETVAEAFDDGDDLAAQIVEEAGHHLGAGMVGVVNGFNPQRLVIGGGVIDGIPRLLEMAEAHVREYALDACTRDLEVHRARFGPEAGVIGGAVLARQAFADRSA